MKKILVIALLISCLIFTAALAAPTRQRSESFALTDAELLVVQPLFNTVAFAAFQKDILSYAGDSAPDQALVEGVLLRALEERMFPVELIDLAVTLTDQQVGEMAAQLFAWQGIAGIQEPLCPCIERVAGGLRFDLSGQPDFIGVYAYDAAKAQEGQLHIQGDVYQLSGIEGLAEDVPEDSILWLGHITLALTPHQNAPGGYVLSSYEISETYQATGLIQFFDEENGFELAYPDIFPVIEAPPEPGQPLALESADEKARLGVSFIPGTLSELEAAWQAEGAASTVGINEFGQLTYKTPGEMRLAMPDEMLGACVVLSLVYPQERAHEFGLYLEFLMNSFVVYAFAAG